MRCRACNDPLEDFEAVNKSKVTGEFLDLCSKCLFEAGFPVPMNPKKKEINYDREQDHVE